MIASPDFEPKTRRTGAFARVFGSTAAAYKFFWLLALLKRVQDSDLIPVREITADMVTAAWPSAALYRLSFGPHDRLQDLVRDLQSANRLSARASEHQIKRALDASRDATRRIEALGRYVPTRFLAPWHGDALSPTIRDDKRTRAIVHLASERHGTPLAGPYRIVETQGDLAIEFDATWRAWLLDNCGILQGFAESQLSRFLQARNPHVPGIIDKLGPPPLRDLSKARRWFKTLAQTEEGLSDLYTGEGVIAAFAVDHFLPRAFVAHDLLWNLVPAAPSVNARKADSLPHAAYLPALAAFHFRLVHAVPTEHRDLEDYATGFATDEAWLRSVSWETFQTRYSDLFSPLLQIARNQGFPAGWQA
jgi:hypothetical protein